MNRLFEQVRGFLRDESGTAAAEMALVTPLLLILMFGGMELGKFFLDQHVVVKSVRDGARYAARQPFGSYVCSSKSVSGDVVTRTRNLIRTGQISTGGTPRLSYWTDPTKIDVEVDCDETEDYQGIYRGSAGALTVTVRANVEYVPLLGGIGLFELLGLDELELNAQSHAAVAGV